MSQPYQLRWESVYNQSKNPNWIFKDLHRLLYREEFWQKITANNIVCTKIMRQNLVRATKNHEYLDTLSVDEVFVLSIGLSNLLNLGFDSVFSLFREKNINNCLRVMSKWESPAWCCSIKITEDNLLSSKKNLYDIVMKKFNSNKFLNLLFWTLKKAKKKYWNRHDWLQKQHPNCLPSTLKSLILMNVFLSIQKQAHSLNLSLRCTQFNEYGVVEYKGPKKNFMFLKDILDSFAHYNKIEYMSTGNLQNKKIKFIEINITYRNNNCEFFVCDIQLSKFLVAEKILNTSGKAIVCNVKINSDIKEIISYFYNKVISYKKLSFLNKKQLSYCEYIVKESFFKTVACKYKLASRAKVLEWLDVNKHFIPFVTSEHIALKDA